MTGAGHGEDRLTIGDVLRRSAEHLAGKGSERPRLDAERLLGRVLGVDRIELYMHLDRPLTRDELDGARALVTRRASGEPLQYVLGEWGFRRLTLAVDRRALIPRPETETVVERCLALLRRRRRADACSTSAPGRARSRSRSPTSTRAPA